MHLGEARDVLEHDGKQYSVISESKTIGLAALLYKMNIHREARGLVTKSGLRPLHFQEERTRKPKRTADFDWDAKQIKLTDGDNVTTQALPDNSFDQTSFAYAFAFRSPDDELPPLHLTDGRKLTDYKRGFEVWIAVEHHYLPVQIRYIEKDGTVLDSTVTAISYQ